MPSKIFEASGIQDEQDLIVESEKGKSIFRSDRLFDFLPDELVKIRTIVKKVDT